MYSYDFRQFHEAGSAEQVARAEFYQGAIDASVAQKASRRADSRLLYLALCWAATMADIPAAPESLKAWGPDHQDAVPEEPPAGKVGKEASAYFRLILGHLENWPRQADGTPVGPESVVRRPSEATTAFLAGLPESESTAIKALASAAVRFGDRTRQASGNRKGKGTAEAEGAESTKGASGNRKAESAEGKTGDKPDFSGMDPLAAAAAALKWAAEATAEAAKLAAAAADTAGAPDTTKEAASFAAKAEKLAAKAASLAGMK